MSNSNILYPFKLIMENCHCSITCIIHSNEVKITLPFDHEIFIGVNIMKLLSFPESITHSETNHCLQHKQFPSSFEVEHLNHIHYD